jgi:rhodanese-related sulfurtransferase
VPDSSKYLVLDCRDFKARFKEAEKHVLIDIREYADYRKSRIKGAVNIPRSGGYDTEADSLDKESILFIYCYAGVSSKKAAIFFYNKGFRKIYSLKGGMMKWKRDRMPVERKKLRKEYTQRVSQKTRS